MTTSTNPAFARTRHAPTVAARSPSAVRPWASGRWERLDRFDPNRVGLDHVSLLVETVEELHAASARLEAAGVGHGVVTELPAFGLAILSVQDPDGINVELAALLTRP